MDLKFKALIPLMLSVALHAAVFSGIAGMAGGDIKGRIKEPIDIELNAADKTSEFPDINKKADRDKLKTLNAEPKDFQGPDGNEKAQARGNEAENALTYKSMVLRRLQENRKYPLAAKRRGTQGIAAIAFRVMADGRAESTVLTSSSGDPVLDNEALMMVKRAAPFPRPASAIDMNVEVVFKLN